MQCSATQSIEFLLAAAGTACQCLCTWVETDGSTTYAPGNTSAASNGTNATTVMAAPSGSNKRQVIGLTIYNGDSTAHTVTVQQNDNGTLRPAVKMLVAAGQTLQYSRGVWSLVPNAVSGLLVKTTVLTNASGTFTTQPTTRTIYIRGVGGGGGGGGISTVTSAGGGGGGGASGSYAEKTFVVLPSTGYSYTCGGGGNGGTAGNTGSTGTQSTFVVGGVTCAAPGGLGGVGGVAVAGPVTYLGGASPAAATNADLAGRGNPGMPGMCISVTVVNSGCGGSSALGGGGAQGLKTQSAGTAATGYGSGGSGACLINGGASVAGGAGSGGCWVVDEYS